MTADIIGNLAEVLGSYRAENLGDRIFSLYTTPAYFPELLSPVSCFLQGGRGTGKTTVLKCLSYEGQYRLDKENFDSKKYIGLYFKLETGLVNAFSGGEKNVAFWQKLFSHFINLQLCKQLCEFVLWYQKIRKVDLHFDYSLMQIFCTSIKLSYSEDIVLIRQNLDVAIAEVEADLNDAYDQVNPKQSPIGNPIRRFIKFLKSAPELASKNFYILFDEYENLQSFQQATLNTLIKQADVELLFKVGIRELGLRTRHTLNADEQLVDPADYKLINISKVLGENEFDKFSREVLYHRFDELKAKGIEIEQPINELFEDLSEEEEAKKLGAENIAKNVEIEIRKNLSEEEISQLYQFTQRELALMEFFSYQQADGVIGIYRNAIKDRKGWENRVNNYGVAALFSLRKKKVGISKYYSGWNTMLSLSAGNIRYLLQLVTNSMIDHATQGKNFRTQKISAKCQTEVAAEVGKKNLLELEGLSTRGAQLMKLVLGLGQVLHQMAIQAEGHAPELTQFEVSKKLANEDSSIEQVNDLLNAAVMHLALLRTSGTKLGGPGDTRDFDYMLHPIFSPFFVYSYRRKRKFSIDPEDLLKLITHPSTTIKTLLLRQNRAASEEIPEQLRLFGGFYDSDR